MAGYWVPHLRQWRGDNNNDNDNDDANVTNYPPHVITLWHCEQVRSCSILVRVYVSHHHENKGPPAFCVPILDVHGLHRVQSRSVFRMLSRHSQSSTTFRNKVPFPVETVVGRDRIKFISNWPYSQLFNYFYRILRPVTAVISFYRLPFLRKKF